MKKSQIITLIFILATLILIILIILKNSNHTNSDLAKCIASKSTLYVATGCSACQHQEKLFGDDFKYLNAVNCAIEPEKCENIYAFPTWIINGEKEIGVQSIKKLKELTDC